MRKKGRLFLRPFRLVIVSISLAFLEYPVALQNQTVEYYFALERCCRYHPDYVTAF